MTQSSVVTGETEVSLEEREYELLFPVRDLLTDMGKLIADTYGRQPEAVCRILQHLEKELAQLRPV